MLEVDVYYCLVVVLVVVWISYWIYSWSNPKIKNGKLPPGSMGLPFIGESIEFFSAYSSHGIPPFIKKRVARYGPLFRTNLVGQKFIVSTDNEINYNLFKEEHKSFQLWYTDSFGKIFGRNNIVLLGHNGEAHKYFKKLVLHMIGPQNLREKLVQEVDDATRMRLRSWTTRECFDIKEGASKLIFDFFSKKLMSYDEKRDSKRLRESYKTFMDGLVSFPLNIPGTALYASSQARKRIIKVIEDIYQSRKASKVPGHDFMDCLLEEMEKGDAFLNDTSAIYIIFFLLFGLQETISTSLALLINFVSDYSDVLTELTKEHETILRKRENKNPGITWEEYKSMTFTHMVISETIRMASHVPGLFRKVVKDVEINGYTIPAGWMVMIVPSTAHFNPDIYDNPLTFNPWRWQGQEMNKGSKTFMAFGCGARLCVGADVAKVQMAIFLHYLVTGFRWSVINGGDFIRKPHLMFPNGLLVKIAEKNK